MIKPKKATCGVKSGKSRSASNIKSWFQRTVVTENLWKNGVFFPASVWQKEHKGVLPKWKNYLFK